MGIFSRVEGTEEEKTRDHVTYQFFQGIVEAKDNASRYIDRLQANFKDEIETVEKKQAEIANILKEIEKLCSRISTVQFGRQQASLVRKLNILKGELERNCTTSEEEQLYEDSLCQMVHAKGTMKHMKQLLETHKGDSRLELIKTLQDNNVNIDAYHD